MKMALGRICLFGALLFTGAVCNINEAILGDTGDEIYDDDMSVEAMGEVFSRSADAHTESMTLIMRDMTLERANEILEKSNLSSPALMKVADMVMVRAGSQGKLRKQPKGYAGLDGAKNLLNDMIFESMTKYDAEIAKCTEYYASQCAAMEILRGEISAANFIAANSRALILDSQATINKAEVDIPTTKLELKQHLLKCEHELYKMNTRLKIILGDIAVMTTILEMTDCDAKKFLQMEKLALLQCKEQCSKKSFITFEHDELRQKVNQLKSSVSKDLMTDTLKDVYAGIEGLEGAAVQLVQVTDGNAVAPVINKTKFNNPPLPKTEVPGNPCTDPDAGAPSAHDKRSAKCVLGGAQCYKLQERFLLIQSGIMDERDDLLAEIESLENFCDETKKTLETQISDDEDRLEDAQTKLAQATEKEATAGEIARQTASKNKAHNADLIKQMKTCSKNYIGFEGEQCALKKIRGELYKMKGDGSSAFFQDCELSKWDPEACTKKCATGEQVLTRKILTQPDGGTKCLPTTAVRSCNNHPCPVDCILEPWSGWSKCSADCGGGVQQRLREVKRAMKYDGHPCGKTSETKACNGQACEKDCELSDWSKWSKCSKDCDGGTAKRQKFVKEQAEGEGTCPDQWSMKRLEYKKCGMNSCKVNLTTDGVAEPLHCNATLDVVLLLDGSGSLGKKGWAAEVKAAESFVDAFIVGGATNVKMAVILYSGPRTWGGVSKCVGKSSGKKVTKKECGITTVSEFTDDLPKLKTAIKGMSWPQGSTLTSLALMTAKAMLTLGRGDTHSIVVTFTDGRPLSFRRTGVAARAVRKQARLLWVPVTKYAPLKYIKKWATRRWQENVVKVDDFAALETPDVITHIIANICPGATGDHSELM